MALPQRSFRIARSGLNLPAFQRAAYSRTALSAPRPLVTTAPLPVTVRYARSSQQQQQQQRRGFKKDASSTTSTATKAPPKNRGASKLYASADAAVADLQSGSTILSAGFGVCGIARQ